MPAISNDPVAKVKCRTADFKVVRTHPISLVLQRIPFTDAGLPVINNIWRDSFLEVEELLCSAFSHRYGFL